MKCPKKTRTWFYILISIVSLLPLAGCGTGGDSYYWRHKDWDEGHRGRWHEEDRGFRNDNR